MFRRHWCCCLLLLIAASDLPAQDSGPRFRYPLVSAVAKNGTIYVADRMLPGIWKIKESKAAVFHQASKKFRTPLNAVWCVTFDSKGRLLAGDSATREVYRFDKDGKPQPLTKGKIGIPISIAADGKGSLYVSDLETQRIWKLSEDGGEPKEFAVIAGPRGLTVDDKGRLWAINSGKNQIVRFTPDGKSEPVVKGRAFRFPHSIVVPKEGIAYVTDGYGKCVWKIAEGQKPVKLVEGKPFDNPVGLVMGKNGLLVTDPRANALINVTADGKTKVVVQGGKPSKKK